MSRTVTVGSGAARTIPILGNSEQAGWRDWLAAVLAASEPAGREPAERVVGVGQSAPRGGRSSREPAQRPGRSVRMARRPGIVKCQG
jgi:hypothetical protein